MKRITKIALMREAPYITNDGDMGLTTLRLEKETQIGTSAFKGCTSLHILVPNNLMNYESLRDVKQKYSLDTPNDIISFNQLRGVIMLNFPYFKTASMPFLNIYRPSVLTVILSGERVRTVEDELIPI